MIRYNTALKPIPVGRRKPYGYYNGYHICINGSFELAQVVDDADGHFDVCFYDSIWRKQGDIEDYNPFIAKSILVPEDKAYDLLKIAFEDMGNEL